MIKGFKLTFSKRNKVPLQIKFIGEKQQLSYFDFGDGQEPIVKCANCGKVHWKDLDYKFKIDGLNAEETYLALKTLKEENGR